MSAEQNEFNDAQIAFNKSVIDRLDRQAKVTRELIRLVEKLEVEVTRLKRVKLQ